jgi:hypothetical protein
VIGVTEQGSQKVNCIQLRGKIPIKVNNKDRPIGFKFILPSQYPHLAPYVYLDEPLDESVIEIIDYVDNGNRIMCDLLSSWGRPFNPQKHCLVSVLSDVYRLFKQAPPLPFSEL